ncbi:type-F conjugative transfer system protein TrbI [Enterobacter ludwigii]|jgi:conjugal transfer pilin signal peptidase TrbI|uniref:type-F conjugative transfer system protein TrbI n=1 Tax=Enterobacter TaxID=547 RepID=UPI000CEBDDB4|nr:MULTISPECIES: type-F conjugative transfer system protein TrbI [Enterobacter]EKS6740432.1 type-F conjugative transfer system protein TrbI [Enterobacter ludwigii]MBK1520767.1 type-F conjugative transfer system protein TrbI [Enterobacter ludwigii]MDR6368658.1 conjugal transfer pilin signal peptidase TrbI [Enterobacter sp. SORGH_AS_0287]
MDATEIPITKCIRLRRQQRSWRRIVTSVAAVSGILLLLNAWLTVRIFCSRQQEVVTFDMQGTVNSFMAQLSHQHPGEEAVKKTTGRFNAALNGALTDWQRHHDVIILVAPAVVAGAPDITPEIQADVAKRMSAASARQRP